MTQNVGIFSRSDESDYAWLMDQLNECCNVLPFYISNNNRYDLIKSLNQCQLAILYHSKNRGRINITDVTDSFYDDEICLLSNKLGRNKVITVIDDLEDSSEEAKQRILSSQPTLKNKTCDIFLFTKTEKQNKQKLREKVQPIIDLIQRAKLGPIPLHYVPVILFPLWIFFSIGENSFLYSLSVIITILLKGSLLSHWVIFRCTWRLLWVILGSGVIILQIYIIGEELHISTFPLVFLVPLSTITGIFLLPLDTRSSSPVIGIFSRCSEYTWLSDVLRTTGEVVPFYITNNNSSEFKVRVSKCSFAILYHSKTRGRLNITDVTDSLYDNEVTHMSEALGKEKVLVVVDDVDDSSDKEKSRIFESQPTIRNQTRGLYLFTREEKENKERIKEKMKPILNTLTRASSSYLILDVVGILILYVPWIHYYSSVYHGAILILSNIDGSLLLYNFLLPSSLGSSKTGLLALLLVMVLELLAMYWYHSGKKYVVFIAQSVSPFLYAALLSLTTTSAAP